MVVRAAALRACTQGGVAAVATVDDVVPLPATPYRGIQPFRYVDHAIFFAREEESHRLKSLVAVYRGVLLYGNSGSGKSSLINAGLLPDITGLGFCPERVRVQPRSGEELVIERIANDDADTEYLPSLLVDDESSRSVHSTEAFEQRVRQVCASRRPLLVFDQFEEILTLFEEPGSEQAQRRIVELLVKLLREPLPVKLLFAFREDHLGRVQQLLGACPELVDHALRLGAPAADTLPTIIGGPFERYPGHFAREFDPAFVETLCAALAQRFGTGDLSLTEVQTVCLRLWRADDPRSLLADGGVQRLLEDYLGEELEALPGDVRGAAISLLSQMVTSAGTRNVISAEDLVQRVSAEEDIPRPLLTRALDRLESESKLVRRERRRDLYLYEITSEFLVPWISQRREELRRDQERARERRRLRLFGSIAGALVVVAAVIAVLAVVALHQRSEARRQATDAESLTLASQARTQLATRPDVSLLLAFAGYRETPREQIRNSVIAALTTARGSGGVFGILHGHSEVVSSVAFRPDGTLASASVDGTIRLWDVRTRKLLGPPLRGHAGVVVSVAFTTDGRTLASAHDDGTIRLWDVRTRKQLSPPLRGHTREVQSVALSPDGSTLASASWDKTIRLWDLRVRKQLGPALRGHTRAVLSVAFSSDGRTLASASRDKTVRLWDVRRRKQRGSPLRGHMGFINSLAFASDGRTLASASDDKTVRLWDVRARTQLGPALRGHTGSVYSVAFSSDGRTLASGSFDETARLWDVRARTQLGPALRGHTGSVYSVAFSSDGRTLASGSFDETVRLWDLRAPRQLGLTLSGHTGSVTSVAFSPDGRTLASASDDKTIRLWDVRARKQVGSLRGHTALVSGVAFSPDGRTLASASYDNTIRLWDLRARRRVGSALRGHTGPLSGVAFSPDGRTLASGSADETIRLWDARTHKQLRAPLRGHSGAVYSVAFSPDGRMLASGSSEDKTVRLWDVRTRMQVGSALRGHASGVFSVAFNSDGRTLVSGGEDKTIRLWGVGTHRQLGSAVSGHRAQIFSVAFSPDGRTLASAGFDRRIRLWDRILWRNVARLQPEICSLVGSGLSRTEWARYAGGISYRRSCP